MLRLVVASATLALSACGQMNVEIEQQKSALSFTATREEQSAKTYLDDDFHVLWQSSDAISVFGASGDNTVLSEPKISEDGKTAIFSGGVELSPSYYALSPAQASATISGGSVSVVLPSTQAATSGSFDPAACLAYAFCSNDKKFQFKQVCSLLGVTVNNDNIVSVSLASSGNLCGSATVDYNSGAPAATITDGRQSVTMEGAFENGRTYWFCVYPGEYSGLQLSFVRSDGLAATYTNPTMVIDARRAGAQRIANISIANSKWADSLFAGTVQVTNSTAVVAWTAKASNLDIFTHRWPKSVCDRYDYSEDITHEYKVSLYTDSACSNLVVEHTLAASDALFTEDYPTRFCFSGLEADTDYWFSVTDLSSGASLPAPLKIHTAGKSYAGTVASEGSAGAGDMILYESFDRLLWGGDLTTFAAGYGVDGENFSTASKIEDAMALGAEPYSQTTLSIVKLRGNNSIAGASAKQIGLFYVNGLRALLPELGLNAWGYTSTDAANTTTSITARPGYLRIGASGTVLYGLASPRLSAIPSGYSASVNVHFRAATYTTPATQYNNKDIAVSVIRGGSMSAYRISGHTVVSTQTVTISGDGPEWKEYSVTLSGVTAKSRIHFAAADAATVPMFMLDDIRVSLSAVTREGYVKDTQGAGISGVSVTDGFSVVQTDSDGHYNLPSNDSAEFVYITVPAEYEIPYNSTGYPAFYKRIDSSLDLDFTLERIGKQNDWTLLVATDVHAGGSHTGSGRNYGMLKNKVLPDMKAAASAYSNLYSVLLGDTMTSSGTTEWTEAYNTLAYSNSGARFFNIPGNHDWWNSSSATTPSITQFTNVWGPTRWSFDRGDVHVVGMNNIRTSGHQMNEDRELTGANNDYQAGFTDEEFAWLQADLAAVPRSKFVVLCVHVPFGEGNNKTKTRTRHVYYHDETIALLSEFAGCRIFSGHSHVNARYHDSDYPAVHESIHVALMGTSGYNIQTCSDGSPMGYQFYSFSGAKLSNAVFKPVGHNAADYQMRVYDGNATFSGTHFGEYGYKLEKGYLVANVFFFNRTVEDNGIQIELWQDGVKCCDMDRNGAIKKTYTNNYLPILGAEGASVSVVLNRDWWQWCQLSEPASGKKDKNGNSFPSKYDDSGTWLGTSEHIYRGKLKTVPDNIADANFEVRVTDPYGNVYSCTELTPLGGAASNLMFWQ